MLIQCLIPRRNGSPVSMGDGKLYAFVANDDDDHVCEVVDKAHIKTLLSHKWLYRPYNAEESKLEKEAAKEAAMNKPKALQEEPVSPPKKVTAGDKTQNDPLPESKPPAAAMATAEGLMKLDIKELAEMFEKNAGRKAHPATSKEKLVAAILAQEDKSGD